MRMRLRAVICYRGFHANNAWARNSRIHRVIFSQPYDDQRYDTFLIVWLTLLTQSVCLDKNVRGWGVPLTNHSSKRDKYLFRINPTLCVLALLILNIKYLCRR